MSVIIDNSSTDTVVVSAASEKVLLVKSSVVTYTLWTEVSRVRDAIQQIIIKFYIIVNKNTWTEVSRVRDAIQQIVVNELCLRISYFRSVHLIYNYPPFIVVDLGLAYVAVHTRWRGSHAVGGQDMASGYMAAEQHAIVVRLSSALNILWYML